ncbi:choline ABC transporter substrate-binding protein [Pseudomonas aeruginosa]|uniref:choline ABC transporter substrate-binding protein n=1 Tax=Pseudomonas aeruginosa TaxID=287 RepID=UPI0011524FC9|nr:choline ABC transporter substrate-binding protein [Pseudomonas aeruginosa]TQI33211.1 choline ABC transporter substrate-binding protein [Pseudomonas aeruginosa]
MKISRLMWVGWLAVAPMVSHAADPEKCSNVRFAEIGWTDITVKTAITRQILENLGYQTKSTMLSMPVTLKSLAEGKDMDIFLGNWMPSMANDMKPYQEAQSIDNVRANLQNAKYTLAVNDSLWQAGLKDFSDIARFKNELEGKIYGIEPGNDGNRHIQDMIDENAYGLKDAGFKVVDSSEAGMLSQVDRATRRNAGVVFLGWEPHPMNTRYKIHYLTGGDKFFGPNFGSATVYTLVRKGYAQQCPNIGRLLSNLSFTLEMESGLMGKILDDKQKPAVAATAWLKANPEIVEKWLDGVTTRDGSPGLAAVTTKLAQN